MDKELEEKMERLGIETEIDGDPAEAIRKAREGLAELGIHPKISVSLSLEVDAEILTAILRIEREQRRIVERRKEIRHEIDQLKLQLRD